MKKVAVILSGAGVFDGAEIHESVITLLALDRHDAQVRIFAPNVLVESARIARGGAF